MESYQTILKPFCKFHKVPMPISQLMNIVAYGLFVKGRETFPMDYLAVELIDKLKDEQNHIFCYDYICFGNNKESFILN